MSSIIVFILELEQVPYPILSHQESNESNKNKDELLMLVSLVRSYTTVSFFATDLQKLDASFSSDKSSGPGSIEHFGSQFSPSALSDSDAYLESAMTRFYQVEMGIKLAGKDRNFHRN